MAGESHTTTDHKKIREWAEERGGFPATVRGTGRKDDAGLLRIDFPANDNDDSLERISWEDFFEKFDEKKLAFLYQEETSGGEISRFNKFISRSD